MAHVDIKEVERVFFMAMRDGWVKGAEQTTLLDMPGYRAIPFAYREWYVLDRYCVNATTGKSAGETTIWRVHVPVWAMHYSGWYDKGAMPFLRRALLAAYDAGEFHGGRGPFTFEERPLVYVNNQIANDFSYFKGREQILHVTEEKMLGYHEYSGMSLL